MQKKQLAAPVLVLALACMTLPACDRERPAGSAGERSGTLVVALLPDQDPAGQLRLHDVLMERIRRSTGLDARIVVPGSYADVVAMFAARDADVAYFGGYTFALASEQAGATPLAMRDIDAAFVSYVLVPADSGARSLDDLAGGRFAFGARLSTSGHIMPRYFMRELGMEPDDFFGEVLYSGAHDRTFQWVAERRVDAGVMNGQIARRMLAAAGEPAPVRILWQSPPYADYVWAVQPDMTQATRERLTAAFLSLTRGDPDARRFLDAVGARHYLPADDEDFDPLRAAINSMPAAALPSR